MRLGDYLAGRDLVTLAEIRRHCGFTRTSDRELGLLLRQLGWDRYQWRDGKLRMKGWRRVERTPHALVNMGPVSRPSSTLHELLFLLFLAIALAVYITIY